MDKTLLRNLISAWLDGTLSEEELAELELLMLEDSSARKYFLNQMDVHAELSNVGDGDRCFEVLDQSDGPGYAEESPSVLRENVISRSKLPPAKSLLAIATIILVATGFWIGLLVRPHAPLPHAKVATNGESDNSPTILGSIEPVTERTAWYIEGTSEPTEVGSLIAGDVLRVTSGKLELTYYNGIQIVLHSPAAYQVLTGMKARMLLGRLTAVVSEEGKGFSLITPQATVIDLGTQFGVEIDNDGATDVVVFKGTVDVDYHKKRPGQDRMQRLVMGEAIRLDSVGTTSRIVSINQRHYSAVDDELAEKSGVISSVYDNVDRDSGMMNYYEINHQGMREDALAFVDRIAHEWNGIDSKGMPRYLLGADYVKTFNSDKYAKNIEVSVKLAVPSKLYVLFDDRLRIPSWLSDGFEDTGDDIGIDNGPFFSNGQWHKQGPSGIGPGESIEDVFSVWVKEIPEPCIFKLGSTETSQGSTLANMYGIAATPLESN